MTKYIIRRLLLVPVLLIGTTILTFAILQFLTPTERSALYMADVPRNENAWNSAIRKYCLDCPITEQYWRWLVGVRDPVSGEYETGLLRGHLGYSRSGHQYVSEMIARRFPATLELALWSILPIVGGGIWLGVKSAVNHNNLIDQVVRVISIIGWSFPTFVFGLLVLMYFYANLEWFPPGRLSLWANQIVGDPELFVKYTKLVTVDSLLNLRFDIFWDAIRHLILPIVTLSYLSWALLLRVTRSSMLETLHQDYVTTARAKGLREKDVINRHARPNALLPVLTLAGFTVVGLLNGVVITETIFNYPGIGKAAAAAALSFDVITVLGLALFSGFILVFANLVVDIAYVFVDPRVILD
ncbi:MAG: ABC transporter permease [Chloroflexi bacterium]|nr:ABC transporter permease [Chloroflexota bacterium]